MSYASPTPPRRPGPPPAVVAICIVIGGLLLITGPGACAVSCVSAQSALEETLEACTAGRSDECREGAGSDAIAKQLGEDLALVTMHCGDTPTFAPESTHVSIDAPWDMRAEIRGRFAAGSCGTSGSTLFRLHGHPLAWRVVDIVEP